MAPQIVQQLRAHSQYFEPFCGSMTVLFAKDSCSQETVNDLHGDLTNLAWCLQAEGSAIEIFDRSVRTLFSESMIKSLWRELADGSPAKCQTSIERISFSYSPGQCVTVSPVRVACVGTDFKLPCMARAWRFTPILAKSGRNMHRARPNMRASIVLDDSIRQHREHKRLRHNGMRRQQTWRAACSPLKNMRILAG
jgi:hypothetical protein